MVSLRSVTVGCGGLVLLVMGHALVGCDDTLTNGNFGASVGGAGVTPPAAGSGGTAGLVTTVINGTTTVVPAAGGAPSLAPLATAVATNVVVVPATDATCKFPANYSSGNGSLTWYLFSQGSAEVNCSYRIATRDPDSVEFIATGNGQYFAAMNTADYSVASMCGACVEVTRDGVQTVTATVVDQCPVGSNPKCKAGHIDLSKLAFLQVGTEVEGYVGTGNGAATGVVAWRYIPCPSVGNVAVRYKEASNIFWNEFLVENHRNPIAKFEVMVTGAYVTAERKSYNYFAAKSATALGAKLGDLDDSDWPLKVRITDINGSVIEGAMPMPSGVPRVDFGVQFPACTQ